MCCKYEVSLYSFVIGMMVCIFLFCRTRPSYTIYLFYRNKEPSYPDKVLGSLIFFYSFIQMSESSMLLELSKKDVNTYMGHTKTEYISLLYILYSLVLATGIGLYFTTKDPIIILTGIGVLIHRVILYYARDNCE